MTKGLVRCETCGTDMIREYDGGKVKLRASILVWDEEGKCIGKCQKCGADVSLNISLNQLVTPRSKKRPIHVVFPLDKRKQA